MSLKNSLLIKQKIEIIVISCLKSLWPETYIKVINKSTKDNKQTHYNYHPDF